MVHDLNPGAKLRFDVYEADPVAGELRREGVRIPLEERPFRALVFLLRRANEVVTRDELKRELWSPDVFIDFDQGLNTVVRKVRVALNERSEEPRFIATIGRRGYRFLLPVEVMAPPARAAVSNGAAAAAPARVAPVPHAATRRRPAFALAALLVVGAVLLLWFLRPETPRPEITHIVPLTTSGGAWFLEPLYVDAERVYYQSIGPTEADWIFRQILLSSGANSATAIPPVGYHVRGLSPDGAQFLVISKSEPTQLWTVPVAGGAPRRLGDAAVSDGTWSHDGATLAYSQDNRIFLAHPDGSDAVPLATVPLTPAVVDHLRWSPDDRRLRFTVYTGTTASLWEVGRDGRGLHALPLPWPGSPLESNGDWTPDGRYFIFRSKRHGSSDLWALADGTDWWRRPAPAPTQLTFGPLQYNQPVVSRDGKTILAIGVQPAGELVHYDAGRKEFLPFLDGRSIDYLRISPDGRSIAYMVYPDATLWRARIDGSQATQLTFPPLQMFNLTWSPDSTRIAFAARQPGQRMQDYVISADGGSPKPFPEEKFSQASPGWIPGSEEMIYGRAYGGDEDAAVALYRFDPRSGTTTRVPGSDGLSGPMWSPDGRYLAAEDMAAKNLYLFDLATGKRVLVAADVTWPAWSRDSRYLYYNKNGISRTRIADLKQEHVADLPFRLASGYLTVAPDGSPVVLREHGHYDVYALTLTLR